MHVLIIGGAGFVGLNVASVFLAAGHRVSLFDKALPPRAFESQARVVTGDVRDRAALSAAISTDIDVVVLGAAVTAGPAREASDPETILAVNLGAMPAVLAACRDAGARRIINLSSAAAFGAAPAVDGLLREETPAEPESLYAITKYASERVAARLGSLWQLDVVNVRLSAVFGQWERATGVRDTLSPQAQMVEAALNGRPAVLARPGARDWIYATDVGEAVLALATRREPCGPLYNITTGQRWSALAWGEAFARHVPGFSCRLAEPGETPTIDLHSAVDRPSLCEARMRREIGWRARYGLDDSARELAAWMRHQAKALA